MTTTSRSTALAPDAGARPSAPTNEPPIATGPNSLAVTTGLVLAVLGSVYLAANHGAKQAVLFVLGIGLGVALFHARFGFTSAWRQLVSVGQGRGLRAHTVLLGTTAALFAVVLATGVGFGGVTPQPSVDPIGVGTMVGASVVGWGLVTNAMPDSTWNNWQGYLLKAFMGTELVEDPAGNYWVGDWSYANLGVLVALVLAFVVTWVGRRAVVRRQEASARA